jgi:RNA polymerase sigma-70 factor (ECF subfamily)
MADIEDLYRQHGGILLAYLHRGFGRCAAPEDLLQETFLHALRHPDRLAAAGSQRAWLFGVARHVGLTAARKHRPAMSLDLNEPHRTESRPELAAMREAIDQLPPLLKEALELRLRENLTYDEIAHVLDIPIGTVRSRLHFALRQLRTALTNDENRSHHHG